MRRWRAVVWTSAALVAAGCGGGGGGSPERVAPAPPPPRQQLTVEVRTEELLDTTRSTPAYGTVPESSGRSLPTRIAAPAAGQPGGPYPLVVFAHGSGGLGARYDVLLRTWASAGYVVAAPFFPVATGATSEPEWSQDMPNLPGDISFVIDEVLRLRGDAVDPAAIGVAGHSMGGMVTLAVAGNTCCHDTRIKAAVVLAGRETPFGTGRFWSRIITPVLFVHGDADDNIPWADGRRAFANAPPPRFLLTVLGGDHGEPFTAAPGDQQATVVTDVVLDFFDHFLQGVADGLDHLQSRAGVPGVARLDQER